MCASFVSSRRLRFAKPAPLSLVCVCVCVCVCESVMESSLGSQFFAATSAYITKEDFLGNDA